MASNPHQIEDRLVVLRSSYPLKVAAATSPKELSQVRADLLGKSGEVEAILRLLGPLQANQRARLGREVSCLVAEIKQAINQHPQGTTLGG